ncbi:MAG: hypothetical protein JWR80_474 [Bradyrhizobium sp.]|nr:hypothetical protein [Bradyrhizobium sp.]
MTIVLSVLGKLQQFRFAPQERLELARQAAAYEKKVNRIGRLKATNHRLALYETQKLLSSARAKVCAIVRTTPHAEAAVMTMAELYRRARALTPHSLCREVVRVHFQPKPGGGFRPIAAFGPGRLAYQKICQDLLKAELPSYSFDFGDGGGGIDRMTDFILHGLQSGEYDHVVTADVRDCYGSITEKEVLHRMLRMPRWLIETGITVDSQTLLEVDQRYGDMAASDADGAVRRGLPQGASPSALIMSRAILGPVLAGTFFADRLALYGDNIAVLARSRQDGEAIYSALSSVLQGNPVGPLTIGEHDIQNARNKITLVQYALKPVRPQYGSGWRVMPSWKSYRKFEREVARRAAAGDTWEQIEEYGRAWANAFRLWHPVATSFEYLWLRAREQFHLGRYRSALLHSRID